MSTHLVRIGILLAVGAAAPVAAAEPALARTTAKVMVTETKTRTMADDKTSTTITATGTRDVGARAPDATEAKRDLAFEAGLGVGAQLSTTSLGVGPGLGVDLGGRHRLGSGAIALHLRTQYQSYSKDGGIGAPCAPAAPAAPSGPCLADGSMGYTMREQALDFGLRVAYRVMPIESKWTPYFGAGPKLFLQKVKSTSFGVENTETDAKLGFVAFGGGKYDVGPGHLFGELEYQWAGLSHMTTGAAHLAGLGVVVGYRIEL